MTGRPKIPRKPAAFTPEDPLLEIREAEPPSQTVAQAPVDEDETIDRLPARRFANRQKAFGWGGLLFSALGGLLSLAAGLWFTSYVERLFSRYDWIGWAAAGLLSVALFAAFMITIREIYALSRLRKMSRLRMNAEAALESGDKNRAEKSIGELKQLLAGRDDTTWSLARLKEHDNDIMSARERLTLAERLTIAPLDARARTIIATSAKRVSVVTAISPMAFLDMGFVALENLRMMSRLAALYGGRPGLLSLIRLARMVVTHLALTGGIALGDDIIQQLIGHKIAAKFSARLGEGVLNGALTLKIGIAATGVIRPLPWIETPPPRFRDFLTELIKGGKKPAER